MSTSRKKPLLVVRSGLIIAFFIAVQGLARAQQADIPPAPKESEPDISPSERIVEGRPDLLWLKRSLHPATWLGVGIRPILHAAERIKLDGSESAKPPRDVGVKFGIRGHGQGAGLGPEVKPFHRNLFNRGIQVEMPLSVTYKNYQLAMVNMKVPMTNEVDGRLGIELTGRYTSRPSENFFGIGNESLESDRSKYRGVMREAGGDFVTRMGKLSLRVGASYRSVGITRARRYRSASDVFRSEEIPGLTVDPVSTLLISRASVEHDSRDNKDLPSRGGLQQFEVRLNEGLTGGDFSYWQYRGELQQFFPLSSEGRHVIGVRGSIETNQAKGGSDVPFFDLPTIGGFRSVRGFDNRRFIDRSAMNGTLEYRYRIWRHFDWGFFLDAGQVAPEIGDFARNRLHKGYGMRFIVRARENRAFVIDMARSREEPFKLYVDFSPFF